MILKVLIETLVCGINDAKFLDLNMIFLIVVQNNSTILRFTDKMKSIFNEKINKFSEYYSAQGKRSKLSTESTNSDKIIFVLPLSGRYETFLRFLNNFEDVSF